MENDPSPATLEPRTGSVSAAVPGYAARATMPPCNGNPAAAGLLCDGAEAETCPACNGRQWMWAKWPDGYNEEFLCQTCNGAGHIRSRGTPPHNASSAGSACLTQLVRSLLPLDQRHRAHAICRLPKGFRLLQPFEKITPGCKFTRPTSPEWGDCMVVEAHYDYDPKAYFVHAKPNDQGEAQPPAKKTMNTPKDSTGGCCPPPPCSPDPFPKWKWMMDYCKRRGTSPTLGWDQAEKAWQENNEPNATNSAAGHQTT
jgi:hypothetical protein